MGRDDYAIRRHELVEHVKAEGISKAAVLAAIERVPRHEFVEEGLLRHAYEDRALPIGEEQTISQPFIVALMTEMALGSADRLSKVLEIGTGCGYQSAVIAELSERVFTVERIACLQDRARRTLANLGYENIEFRVGDGYEGWEEHQPFDAIIVTAAPPEVPPRLLEQLALGGRLVIPVGEGSQYLRTLIRTEDGYEQANGCAVRFVPMVPGATR